MRESELRRLDSGESQPSDPHYLHYKYLVFELKSAIERFASGRVLDIGCGNKPYRSLFKGKIEHYIGCDIVQSHLHMVDVLCEATHIPLAAASFDTIFSSQTIEHVAEHQEMISEAFQLLKPNGYLILSGPFCWPLHEEPYDFFRFSKYGYAHILTKAGFRVIEIQPNGGMWAATGLLIIEALSNSRHARYWLSRSIASLFFCLHGPYLVNKVFSTLDEKDFNPVHTLNYVVVAQKPTAVGGV